ncbi:MULTISPECIES: metallophosphoesterase family protein [unclassified Corynebacterium]|uniref:metallophosphoesterase family protein n=1 Tax=unclassified Corynebacterium TaxID=2624378 RepID=UPI002167B25A|nr:MULTISPECIES: metallophosphoesterase [unclassified Corynebacterium]MCS4492045.1 metallophosphoesterase [Corynebacterium sp. ES2715-CONJ3]MCS4532151.1 metallophosphoesterase [Corynebacterium sp. ES2730-CONJ]
MNKNVAFIGDVHGHSAALRTLIEVLEKRKIDEYVFLGDYINRGPDSKGVVDYLLELQNRMGPERLVFLRGNHEESLVEFLETDALGQFLSIGGAATVRSYHPAKVSSAPGNDFRKRIPSTHVEFFLNLKEKQEEDEFIASHKNSEGPVDKFFIYGHSFSLGEDYSESSICIDTGCGFGGLLTALVWPHRKQIRVSESGELMKDEFLQV